MARLVSLGCKMSSGVTSQTLNDIYKFIINLKRNNDKMVIFVIK